MRKRTLPSTVLVVIVAALCVVAAAALMALAVSGRGCNRGRLGEEAFTDMSTSTRQVYRDDGQPLQDADPRCWVQTPEGKFVMRTPGLASVPGVMNTCYFLDEQHPLIDSRTGGCSATNSRLKGLQENKLRDDKLPLLKPPILPPVRVGPRKDVPVTGFTSCTIEFPKNVTASIFAGYDFMLTDQMAIVSPRNALTASLYNSR
jgi:hypothetical protein